MTVSFVCDPLADGVCAICRAPCSAAIVIDGEVTYACRRHIAAVDRATLAMAAARHEARVPGCGVTAGGPGGNGSVVRVLIPRHPS